MQGRVLSIIGAGFAYALVAATATQPRAAARHAIGDGTRETVVAAVLMRPGLDPARNRRYAEMLIARAAAQGASIVVLPELALASVPARGRELIAHAVPGPSLDEVADVARAHGVAVVTSVLERARGTDEYYVAPVLVDREGEFLFHARKVMPPRGRVDARFVRGDAAAPLETVELDRRRLGVLAGDDVVPGVARLAARGADIVFVPGNWSRDRSAAEIREQLRQLSRRWRVHLVVAGAHDAVAGVYRHDTGEHLFATDERVAVARLQREPQPAVMPAALGLPQVPVPRASRPSAVQVELGRQLFIDTALSRNGRVSCATCHQPDRAFANGEATAAGIDGRRNHRNVPTLLNVGFRAALFWDGSSTALEHQAQFPLNHAAEMDRPYFDVAAWVARQPKYVAQFREIGVDTIEFEAIAEALATYQRSLVSASSRFDRYFYGGEREALSERAARGLEVFRSKGRCSGCHTIGSDYALFTDQRFHNTGVGFSEGMFRDLGLGSRAHGGSRRAGFFLTPSLRNVALTAPYMHDGSLPTLASVVEFYERGGNPNPNLDPDIRPIRLTAQERSDLIAFLEALTGDAQFSPDGRRLNASMTTDSEVPVAAIQFAPTTGEIEANTQALVPLVREAAANARVIVLPEHALTGPLSSRVAPELVARLAARVDRARAALAAEAREHGVWIACPTLQTGERGGEYRIAIDLLTPTGDTAHRFHKLRPRRELGDGLGSPGSDKTLHPIETPLGRIGATSGDDVASAVAQLAERGARIVLVTASWQSRDGVDWLPLVSTLARTHRVGIAIANLRGESGAAYGALVDARGDIIRRDTSADPRGEILQAPMAIAPEGRAPALGLPPIPVPAARPIAHDAVSLGRDLFADPVLSRDRTVSCATCHDPKRAFTDGQAVASGIHQRRGTRNVPTLLNVVYRPFYSWDGAVPALEEQVLRALHAWAEMDADCADRIPALESDSGYAARFRRWTARAAITHTDVARALADYVRTLVSGDSPFDRYYFRGEMTAISPEARRGFALFTGKARCSACHIAGPESALFADNSVHNTGVGYHPRFEYLGYGGDGLAQNLARANTFRGEYVTPTLRNVAETAPYMHDGSLTTLDDVVDFYDRGGVPNPFLDHRIGPLGLTPGERRDLVAFLRTLTGTRPTGATP